MAYTISFAENLLHIHNILVLGRKISAYQRIQEVMKKILKDSDSSKSWNQDEPPETKGRE